MFFNSSDNHDKFSITTIPIPKESYEKAKDDLAYYQMVSEILKNYKTDINAKIPLNGVSDFFASAIFTLSSVIVNLTDSSQRIQDLERQMACLAGSMHISKSEKSSILKLIDKVEAETSDRINECEEIIRQYNEENRICVIL